MEHERDPFGRGQPVRHHQQGPAHGYQAGTGDALVAAGLADAVSFAARFIAHPRPAPG